MDNKKIDWSSIEKEDVEFAFTEAKDLLKQTAEFYDALSSKVFSLLNTVIFFTGGLSSFIFISKPRDTLSIIISFSLLSGFILSFLFLLKAIKAGDFYHIGKNPTDILSKKNNKEKKDHVYMLECELLSYDERIEKNLERNKKMGLDINMAFYSIFVGFAISFILILLQFI